MPNPAVPALLMKDVPSTPIVVNSAKVLKASEK
jgi:hypothetical protein